ncbi:type I restriction-modification system subunit M [Campylobacter corcagiensis]|uniref:site-specific DNA-methyltransferase (adenine-specific) n=1 Tax=Campylobacter corcagiensis TaxID=1448857 RepID=A0A7M1LH11_9BACT|nr:class I SAM-dependent DNA methyltransferase [Campylobacter corcagiensis]QKF64710.1 type I restriction/modification system, methylation subunit [Campylobacter corcagiensis]QOQ87126.1 SAM-dependent DNA methyltransferase [Campylobacter corcagiensis]
MDSLKNINLTYEETPINVTSTVNFIWSIANKLRGIYQSDKYKEVIIPMTIIRRFECALSITKDEVIKAYDKNNSLPAAMLCKFSKFDFYNTSKFNLENLLNDPDQIAQNFKSYIKSFSPNVKDIIKNLEFEKQIDKMANHDILYPIIQAFSELDLDPKTIDNMTMGYIFEELIRKFSENAEAGDHYTGRDIIKLMVSVLLSENCEDVFEENKIITILDQAAGTGGMLSVAADFIKHHNPSAYIKLFSQEKNPESYAMCLAEMLIRGQDADNIMLVDTMKKDCFEDQKMRFVIENPPFGTPWGGKDASVGSEEAVRKEANKPNSRFFAGLPATSDSQLLFIQSAIHKLDDNLGRAAIIQNGSSLFSGGTSSGESQIRRYLLENDLIEAIIALNTDMFYNTGISTFIWILSKNKRKIRKGKIQLINAAHLSHKLRKSLGNKKNEITKDDREAITKLYKDFKENKHCKIYDNTDFIYKEYAIYQPLQRSYAINDERVENLLQTNALSTIFDKAKFDELNSLEKLSSNDKKTLTKFQKNENLYNEILNTLNSNKSDKIYLHIDEFKPVIESFLPDVDKKLIDKICEGLSKMDKNAKIQKDKKGNIIYDKSTKDTEIIPFKAKINEYMKNEVLPHIPDAKAFFEENLNAKKQVLKTGAEIPFTKCFYEYEKPKSSQILKDEFINLEKSINSVVAELFGEF